MNTRNAILFEKKMEMHTDTHRVRRETEREKKKEIHNRINKTKVLQSEIGCTSGEFCHAFSIVHRKFTISRANCLNNNRSWSSRLDERSHTQKKRNEMRAQFSFAMCSFVEIIRAVRIPRKTDTKIPPTKEYGVRQQQQQCRTKNNIDTHKAYYLTFHVLFVVGLFPFFSCTRWISGGSMRIAMQNSASMWSGVHTHRIKGDRERDRVWFIIFMVFVLFSCFDSHCSEWCSVSLDFQQKWWILW